MYLQPNVARFQGFLIDVAYMHNYHHKHKHLDKNHRLQTRIL